MAGRGPAPKAAALRQRTNTKSTRARLPSVGEAVKNKVPALPSREGGWHKAVREWWESVWRSPMAAEFLDADMRGGLYLLADLHQARWTLRDNPSALVEVAREIRLQEVRFGLSPVDRSRLQWEVEKPEPEATQEPTRRGRIKAPAQPVADPRSLFKAVS